MNVRVTGDDSTARDVRDTARRVAAMHQDEASEQAGSTAQAAQAAARAGRPRRLTEKHPGDYTWAEFVDSYLSGTEFGSPYVGLGEGLPPHVVAWEYGSDRVPQFGPHSSAGRFLQPALRNAEDQLEDAMRDRIDHELRLT